MYKYQTVDNAKPTNTPCGGALWNPKEPRMQIYLNTIRKYKIKAYMYNQIFYFCLIWRSAGVEENKLSYPNFAFDFPNFVKKIWKSLTKVDAPAHWLDGSGSLQALIWQ
jgi:hypothetical protein